MNIDVLEENRDFIKRSLIAGEVDCIENVREVADVDFFTYLNKNGLLERLSKGYPTPRIKADVPLWFYIAGDISLRLHGYQSFHSFPMVVRTGGMLNALGPKLGKKSVHPATGQTTVKCSGFNHKNKYDRQTPCDQDYLRKIAHDTDCDDLVAWHNKVMPKLLKERQLFDEEGIFIGDASYIFVPDNVHYEGSVVLLFDEHNHPVSDKGTMTKAQLKRCRYRRCYKWVELIHVNRDGDFYFFAAMQLLPGNDHECPVLYELVENFLECVGPGIMKWLLVDRGFLDGKQMAHLKQDWGVNTLSGLRSNMDVLADARGLLKMGEVKWQEYYPPKRQKFPVFEPKKPDSILKREATRQQTLKEQGRWPKPKPPEKVAVLNDLTTWDSCSVPLTVALTENKDNKPPWGLVTTAHTQDGPFMRDTYHLRTAIEERHRQTKLFWDLAGFHSPNFNLVTNQIVFTALAYTLLQMHLVEEDKAAYNRKILPTLKGELPAKTNHVIVYYKQCYAFFGHYEYGLIILDVEEPGKSKLKKRFKELNREMYKGLRRPRAP